MRDPFGISKADKPGDRATRNSAITGAGATTAGVGFIAGGLPGVKADTSGFTRKPDPEAKAPHTGRVRRVATNARSGVRAGRAGVLGFRVKNHEGGTYGFKQKATMGEWYPSEKAKEAFAQGRHRGKVAPEETIIRQMKGGKKVAGGAMAVGGAMALYGQRDKLKSKINKAQPDPLKRQRRDGAAIGAGGAGLAISGGVGGLLGHQQRRWTREEAANKSSASKLIPGLHGLSDGDIVRNPHVFDGVDAATARKAGEFRGAARQANHFAHVYGTTGRGVRRASIPSAIVAGAGVYDLKRKKKTATPVPVQKSQSVSAFGIDHGALR